MVVLPSILEEGCSKEVLGPYSVATRVLHLGHHHLDLGHSLPTVAVAHHHCCHHHPLIHDHHQKEMFEGERLMMWTWVRKKEEMLIHILTKTDMSTHCFY